MTRTRKSIGTTKASDLLRKGTPTAETSVPASKIARVTEMLQRSGGATLGDLVETTGWLPHTTRTALTGLRKKGYTLDKQNRDGVTVYHIAKAA